MNHSPSEQEALDASIEVLRPNDEFHKVLITSLDRGSTPTHKETESRRRITILNRGADYSAVFDQAQSVISNMREAYEEMFQNWKFESEMNFRLAKEVENLKVTIEGQKKYAKQVLDDKSRLQEQLDKEERRPRLQSKVEDLENELKSLKVELDQKNTDKERQNTILEEKTKTLEFYRQEFGVQKEEEVVEFRPRVIPIRRVHSNPSNHRVTKNAEGRKCTGTSKLFNKLF